MNTQDVLDVVQRSVEEWVEKKGSEDDIRKAVWLKLDAKFDKVVTMAIGARDSSFGRGLEVEPNSPGYKLMVTKMKEFAAQWIANNLDTVKADVTEQGKKDLQVQYRREYDQVLKRQLEEIARKKAEEDAESLATHTWLSTDKMRQALDEVIKDEDAEKAAQEAAKGKQFQQRTKLTSAEVLGVVAYDGVKVSELIQEPAASCWHVMRVSSVFGPTACILTNGDEWHPAVAVMSDDKLNIDSTSVQDRFTHTNQLLFNYLDNADRLFIQEAIASYYRNRGETPF